MSRDNDTPPMHGRRSFLKRAGVATAATISTTGFASGRGEAQQSPTPVEAGSSITVGPDTPGLSKSEHDEFVAEMRDKYGEDGVWGVEPTDQFTTQDNTPGHKENLTFVRAWTEHLEATDNDGTVIVESDNEVALYKSDVTDDLGREHYFYWHWTSGQSRNHLTFEGNLWNMWNRVRLNNGYDMLAYDPDGDLNRNGQTYTVGLSAAYKGVGVSISGDFVLSQDTVRPHPQYSEVGSDGEYAVQWCGDYEGTQGFNGTCEERRPNGAGRDFQWKVFLKGGKYKKTV